MRQRLLPLALAASGFVLVAAGAAVFVLPPSAAPADTGTVPSAAAPAASLPPAPSVDAGPRRVDAPRVAAPRPKPKPASAPVALRLPGAKQAQVVPVSTGPSGKLDPPDRVARVGWWRGGAAVGSRAGTVVLVGHVDVASQGPGVFARLRELTPGETVRVRAADGREVRYRVTGRRTYPRTRALPASVFSAGVAPRLALVTCTGDFDEQTLHYEDTLVVYAVPM